ncbi:MAG: hypothetical protein IJP66_09415, partial [Kiritimatiellae bacterium]|nr:hypothetical protein [Kiritimatiellia bacterium]
CFKGAGQRVPTQKERAAASALFLRTMIAQPFVVGCDWFMWCDRPAAGGHKANAEDCNYGLVNEENQPYKELLAAISPLLREARSFRKFPRRDAETQNFRIENTNTALRLCASATENNPANPVNSVSKNTSASPAALREEVSPDGPWCLSNAFLRICGRAGSAYVADEIAFCPVPGAAAPGPVGRLGAMLHCIEGGDRIYADIGRVTDVSLSRDLATGAEAATIRAEGGEAGYARFAITLRLSLAPSSREPLAEILAIENLGDSPIEDWEPFLRPWSLEERPVAVPHVQDVWGAPVVAEWRLPGGGAWGVRSTSPAARRFRFFLSPDGRQHPDARFRAVDADGRSAAFPIAPGEIWRPAVPMTATIFCNAAAQPPLSWRDAASLDIEGRGFPGLGRMEPPMADLLAEIDAALYIVDCDWNMDPEMQREHYEPFVRRLGGLKPAAPILLCGGCTETGVARPQEVFARGVFDKLKAEDPEKWANLHFLSGVGQLPVSSDATTDHIHPNDFGLAHMGPVYADGVRKILFASTPADE